MMAEPQIIAAIKRHEACAKLLDLSRELGVSESTFFNWKAKYGGMGANQLKKLKDLDVGFPFLGHLNIRIQLTLR